MSSSSKHLTDPQSKAEENGGETPRDLLRQEIARKRSTLTSKEFKFLEQLTTSFLEHDEDDCDDNKLTLARQKLEDDRLFFDPQAQNQHHETSSPSTQKKRIRSLPAGIRIPTVVFRDIEGNDEHKSTNAIGGSKLRQERLMRRRESRIYECMWKRHEERLLEQANTPKLTRPRRETFHNMRSSRQKAKEVAEAATNYKNKISAFQSLDTILSLDTSELQQTADDGDDSSTEQVPAVDEKKDAIKSEPELLRKDSGPPVQQTPQLEPSLSRFSTESLSAKATELAHAIEQEEKEMSDDESKPGQNVAVPPCFVALGTLFCDLFHRRKHPTALLDVASDIDKNCDSDSDMLLKDDPLLYSFFKILGASAEDTSAQPYVLSPPLMQVLRTHFPYSKRFENFWLKYSLVRDGAFLPKMLQQVRASTHTLLAIETLEGEVFGAFTGAPWRVTWKYYGSRESFLWRLRNVRSSEDPPSASVQAQTRLERDIDVFNCTDANEFVQLCRSDMIAVGGGAPDSKTTTRVAGGDDVQEYDWGAGLCIFENLMHGTSSPCMTFQSPCLSLEHSDGSSFEIVNVEVWTLTPAISLDQAEKMEFQRLFLEDHATGFKRRAA